MPYGHQSYHDAPVSIAFSSSTEQTASASIPFLYPLPCHKFGYYTTSSGTSTVITHTASTMGAQGAAQQAHGYPHTGETYSQTPCHSLSYLAVVSDPVHAALPSVTAAHCFSVPEQVTFTGAKGKHKQKTGGARTAAPPVLPSTPPPTSCLAKLLSTGAHERKPTLGFDTAPVTAKAQRSSSSSSSTSRGSHVGGPSSQLQHGAGWSVGIPVLTPLQSQSATLSHSGPQTSTSRGSAVSTRLTHGTSDTGTTLLVPKTEKLSPVQLYSTDRSSLT
ncbi:uncharacterized protein LOC102204403, partial [Pundamilia nyererei]|uniref:Uncharacterized protein LOC102204403 n=1 Tax=Pundamilia nyererei TaxID=303518 RepID=A0A9Y6M808_9CICH